MSTCSGASGVEPETRELIHRQNPDGGGDIAVRARLQQREMRLITHNMLTSNIKGVQEGFPLGIQAEKVRCQGQSLRLPTQKSARRR